MCWTDSLSSLWISLCVCSEPGRFGIRWGSYACTVVSETSWVRHHACMRVKCMCEVGPGCLFADLLLQLCKLLSALDSFSSGRSGSLSSSFTIFLGLSGKEDVVGFYGTRSPSWISPFPWYWLITHSKLLRVNSARIFLSFGSLRKLGSKCYLFEILLRRCPSFHYL